MRNKYIVIKKQHSGLRNYKIPIHLINNHSDKLLKFRYCKNIYQKIHHNQNKQNSNLNQHIDIYNLSVAINIIKLDSVKEAYSLSIYEFLTPASLVSIT